MKLSTLTFFAPIIAISLVLISNSSGPASSGSGDRTGSPVSSGNCTACHSTGSSGSFNPSITVTVTDAQSNPVTEYIPGETYTITYQVTSSTGNPSYGIQSTCLLGNNNSAGTANSPSSGAKVTPLNSRWYLEHSQRSSTGLFTVQWTAPAQGSGTVTLYTSALAVNGSGTAGDNWTSNQVSITEGVASSISSAEKASYRLYPNPCKDNLTIEGIGLTSYQIVDCKGQLVKQVQINGANDQIQIDINDLETGLYLLTMFDNHSKTTQAFIKQ